MSALHFLRCLCHEHTFLGYVKEESQSGNNVQVRGISFIVQMTRMRYLVFRQAGTGVIDLERVYEPEDQHASVGLSNLLPDIPQDFGTPDVTSTSYSTHTLGIPLPLRCGCGLCGGLKVPQRPYIPVQTSPDLSQLNGETLTFSKGGCGIHLVDAVKNRLSGLEGGDDLMFVDAPVSTFSLRIEVGGWWLHQKVWY